MYGGNTEVMKYLMKLPEMKGRVRMLMVDWEGYKVEYRNSKIQGIPLDVRCWPLAACVSLRDIDMLDLIFN